MAKWTQFYKIVEPQPAAKAMQDSQDVSGGTLYASHSWYQRLVQGSSTRMTRYREYDMMDEDVDISRALDIISEEMTNLDHATGLPLCLEMQNGEERVQESLVMTLRAALRHWCNQHKWEIRLFNIGRQSVKYGDCFFIKPEKKGQQWEHLSCKHVMAAIVDEDDVTKVIAYQIRRKVKEAKSNYGGISVSSKEQETEFIPADRVVRFTLNDDMSESAPFGESILKAVYRSHKQKVLLEDSIIIYRVSRAPERRVFYVDVGKMPPQRVKQYLEQIKNEIKQKKIPTGGAGSGGATSGVESVYNPHSMNEDFYFAQRADGKGSRVETLPGGQGLGELADLEYFQDKVLQGLRVPTSYMKSSRDENPIFNDGRVGQAYVEELRFMIYCQRLQRHLETVMDEQFKTYLHENDIRIDPTLYKIVMPEGQNFAKYRQQEVDSALLGTLQSADGVQGLSRRFALRRYLQLSEDELMANEKLLREEQGIAENDPEVLTKLYGGGEGGGGDSLGGPGPLSGGGLDMVAEPGDDAGEGTPDLSADSGGAKLRNDPQSNS
jgi:hypothetical protein